jgi:hypothetical protein
MGRLLYVVFDDSNPFGLIVLIMEAARTSETSVDNYFTRQYIPEDKSELHCSLLSSNYVSALLGHLQVAQC